MILLGYEELNTQGHCSVQATLHLKRIWINNVFFSKKGLVMALSFYLQSELSISFDTEYCK